MKIIIPHLHRSISRKRLALMVLATLDKKLRIPFVSMPELISVDILAIAEDNSHTEQHHGLVVVRPDKAGDWLMSKLKSRSLRGKKLRCREYFDRAVASKQQNLDCDCRRRCNLQVRKINDRDDAMVAHGMGQFAITHTH